MRQRSVPIARGDVGQTDKPYKTIGKLSSTLRIAYRNIGRNTSGELIDLENVSLLASYDSAVAVFGYNPHCGYRVYLLPRYDYSVTTWRHVHAFIQDFCYGVTDVDARTMRTYAKLGVLHDGYEYAFAKAHMNCYGDWLTH